VTAYQKLDLALRFERAIDGLFVDPLGPDLCIETLAELLLLWQEMHDHGMPVTAEADEFFDQMESSLVVRNIDGGVDQFDDIDGADRFDDEDQDHRMYIPTRGWMTA